MVTQGKIKDRYSDENWQVYVAKLEEEKFYVGIAVDPNIRMLSHIKQGKNASSWCKKYKPIEIVETFDTGYKWMKDAMLLEDLTTLKYLKKYGPENVRGGKYLGSLEQVKKSFRVHSKKKYISFSHQLLEDYNLPFSELRDLDLYDFICDSKRRAYISNLLILSNIAGVSKEQMIERLQEAKEKFESFKGNSYNHK